MSHKYSICRQLIEGVICRCHTNTGSAKSHVDTTNECTGLAFVDTRGTHSPLWSECCLRMCYRTITSMGASCWEGAPIGCTTGCGKLTPTQHIMHSWCERSLLEWDVCPCTAPRPPPAIAPPESRWVVKSDSEKTAQPPLLHPLLIRSHSTVPVPRRCVWPTPSRSHHSGSSLREVPKMVRFSAFHSYLLLRKRTAELYQSPPLTRGRCEHGQVSLKSFQNAELYRKLSLDS